MASFQQRFYHVGKISSKVQNLELKKILITWGWNFKAKFIFRATISKICSCLWEKCNFCPNLLNPRRRCYSCHTSLLSISHFSFTFLMLLSLPPPVPNRPHKVAALGICTSRRITMHHCRPLSSTRVASIHYQSIAGHVHSARAEKNLGDRKSRQCYLHREKKR